MAKTEILRGQLIEEETVGDWFGHERRQAVGGRDVG
jgi:hypothetical protein